MLSTSQESSSLTLPEYTCLAGDRAREISLLPQPQQRIPQETFTKTEQKVPERHQRHPGAFPVRTLWLARRWTFFDLPSVSFGSLTHPLSHPPQNYTKLAKVIVCGREGVRFENSPPGLSPHATPFQHMFSISTIDQYYHCHHYHQFLFTEKAPPPQPWCPGPTVVCIW